MRVYLAGKMGGLTQKEMTEWREMATRIFKFSDIKVLDPCKTSLENLGDAVIVASNKWMIDNCDVVLAEFDHDNISLGTFGECIYAMGKGKPVVMWGGNGSIISHPWATQHRVCHEREMETAIEFILNNFNLGGGYK